MSSSYDQIIERVFFNNYSEGKACFNFLRSELAECENVAVPKNLGDIIYTYRYRKELPVTIRNTERDGKVWSIESSGNAQYQFVLSEPVCLTIDDQITPIRVIDRTAPLVKIHSKQDEQSILGIAGVNALIDRFLCGRFDRMQSHLRTHVRGIGQIEIDDLYVGDCDGQTYIIPVQAKTGKDRLGATQTKHDWLACREHWPSLKCRPVSVYYRKSDNVFAFMEMEVGPSGFVKKIAEKHYAIV